MLSKVAALECQKAGDRIRVNTVCPGGVKTPMWRTEPFFQESIAQTGSEEGALQALLQGNPHARFAEPEEVALGILYLASDESRYVTGTDLVIDQGGTA
jgi:3(or 17)beta-hydroxysteroid dehydrogenase